MAKKTRPKYITHVNFDAEFTFAVDDITYMSKGSAVEKFGQGNAKNVAVLNQQYQLALNNEEFQQLFAIWTSPLPQEGVFRLFHEEFVKR